MKPKFCPYCGKPEPESRKAATLWWCPSCRKLWVLGYWRQLRAAPIKRKERCQA